MPFDAADYEQREERSEDKGRSFLQEIPPVSPEFQRFFGSRLHDSYVVGTERQGDRFSVRLSHDGIEEYVARPLSKLLGVQMSGVEWPIHLVFDGVSYVRWAKASKTGGLQFVSPKWQPFGDHPRDAFLYDRFTQENGRLQWLAQFWASKPCHRGETIYLMLDCSSCWVKDLREATFVKLFGETYRTLWHRIEADYPDMFSHQTEIGCLIEEAVRAKS